MNTSKDTIGHLTEIYAATGETYIYDQARLTQQFNSVILCETKLGNNYLPFQNYVSLRQQFRTRLFERLRRATIRRIAYEPYLNHLNRFFVKNLKNSNAKIIHAHFGMMGYKCLQAKRELNLPLVTTFYGVDVSYCVRDPIWKKRYKELFRHGDMFIVLCPEAAIRLVELGCLQSKIKIWNIGIPVDEYTYRKPRKLDAQSKKDVRFLIVARFVEKKGYEYLIPAFSKLASQYPDISLTIIGNGPAKLEILERVRSCNISNRVELIDTAGMPDFFKVFKEALFSHDVFVLPSVVAKNGDDEGGTPVVITNAMAVGLPVVSTTVGGIPNAIDTEVSGLLAEPENIDDLADKMKYLIDNPSAWESLSKNAREKIESEFNLPKQIAKLEEYYRELR